MSKFLKQSLAAVGLAFAAMGAQADVLTFEDRPDGAEYFLATYHGFNFGDNQLATNAWFSSNSPAYQAKSGTKYVATDYLLNPTGADLMPTMAITSATAITFDGAWFEGDVGNIRYELSLGGQVVYTSTDAPIGSAYLVPQWVASGYNGLVDSIVIYGRQGYFAMDDFTYNSGNVPEPTSLALVALAGLAAAGTARRRKTAAAAA